ncbi:hypothetical protein CC77DRAFT_1008614 [Alternaria alternata]|uniref:Uncharacterized protein n=2 Tax=Alternaria alternata TaxID=5599 RepID=A0A177DMV8_ALTAL|nr:hypothetical protein CC77DRAFT_1008614 [Alternaria alternata]OAG20560.1 hypothetical protein CC77DRAFT_1008614 [Alternaria alternata]
MGTSPGSQYNCSMVESSLNRRSSKDYPSLVYGSQLNCGKTSGLFSDYHASRRTAIKYIMNEIDARVSQGELSTPFEEHYPEPPDYFSQEDFHAAYDHEGFLEMLAKLPKKDVERYFKNLKRREKWDLREKASKTGRFWRQHPGSRARYFPNAGSSIEQYISCLLSETFGDYPTHMSQEESVTQTELWPDVAEGRSSSQDTKLCTPVEVDPVGTHTDFLNAGVYYNSYDADLPLYEPTPQRKHNIAADLEEPVRPSTVDEPTTTARYETSDVTWTQQDIYQYQQNQQNQQNTWQIYAHDYHRQYMEGHYAPRYRSLPQTQALPWHQEQQVLEFYISELNPLYRELYSEQCIQFPGHASNEVPSRPPPTPHLRPLQLFCNGGDYLTDWRL